MVVGHGSLERAEAASQVVHRCALERKSAGVHAESESESEGVGDVYLQRANSAVNCTNPTEQLKPQQSEPSTEQPSSSSSCFVLLVAVCPSVASATAAVVSYAHGPN